MFEMGVDIGRLAGMMGEWMYADFQYEYDSSLFALKSERALDSWKGVGQFAQAACEDPLLFLKASGEAFIPGIMEVWRDPTSARAWGAAAVDVALMATVVGKVGRGEKVLAGVGSFSREASVASKCAGVVREGELLKISLSSGEFAYTKTAARHANEFVKRGPHAGKLERPYMNSPHTINEIMSAKSPIPDPHGATGALRWDVPGAFRNNEGTWELVLHPETGIIYHFNFK